MQEEGWGKRNDRIGQNTRRHTTLIRIPRREEEEDGYKVSDYRLENI